MEGEQDCWLGEEVGPLRLWREDSFWKVQSTWESPLERIQMCAVRELLIDMFQRLDPYSEKQWCFLAHWQANVVLSSSGSNMLNTVGEVPLGGPGSTSHEELLRLNNNPYLLGQTSVTINAVSHKCFISGQCLSYSLSSRAPYFQPCRFPHFNPLLWFQLCLFLSVSFPEELTTHQDLWAPAAPQGHSRVSHQDSSATTALHAFSFTYSRGTASSTWGQDGLRSPTLATSTS